MEEKFDFLIKKKLDKVRLCYDPEELCKQLEQLRKWALAGIHMFELPAAIKNSSKESDIDYAIMQYCYYRLLYYLAEKIIYDLSNDVLVKSVASDVDELISSPIGCGVTKDIIIKLCENIVDKFSSYCNGDFLGDMTAYDVAKEIIDNKGITKKLLVEAILNPL